MKRRVFLSLLIVYSLVLLGVPVVMMVLSRPPTVAFEVGPVTYKDGSVWSNRDKDTGT